MTRSMPIEKSVLSLRIGVAFIPTIYLEFVFYILWNTVLAKENPLFFSPIRPRWVSSTIATLLSLASRRISLNQANLSKNVEKLHSVYVFICWLVIYSLTRNKSKICSWQTIDSIRACLVSLFLQGSLWSLLDDFKENLFMRKKKKLNKAHHLLHMSKGNCDNFIGAETKENVVVACRVKTFNE